MSNHHTTKRRASAARVTRLHWSVHIFAAFSIVGGALYFSDPANATPFDDASITYTESHGREVCAALDNSPTETRILSVMNHVQAAGYTLQQAANVLVLSVDSYCPQHKGLVDQFGHGTAPAAA
ncbi:DUF732 domain-containing protein, partial [Mycobacterium sp. 1465703.0]|uniref:DUF732 domain-containing protein n=1 Tax=Mycobacterium sp. 1465703.0 TaxID=1834078 RepID=UPI000A83BAD9